jgi:peptidoglycan/LPS O-acetylase OafA/YrhL
VVRPTRTRSLVLLAAGVAVVTWIALRWWASSGNELPMLPWSTPGVMGLLAVAVLVAGWPVRRWTHGQRTSPLDPLRAARTVVLAKAAQYAGALLTGWYVGQVLVIAPSVDVEPRRDLLLRGLVSVAAALLVWLAGWLVERFCRVDRRDDDDERGAGAPPVPTEPA